MNTWTNETWEILYVERESEHQESLYGSLLMRFRNEWWSARKFHVYRLFTTHTLSFRRENTFNCHCYCTSTQRDRDKIQDCLLDETELFQRDVKVIRKTSLSFIVLYLFQFANWFLIHSVWRGTQGYSTNSGGHLFLCRLGYKDGPGLGSWFISAKWSWCLNRGIETWHVGVCSGGVEER